jgi:hypothetical protein
LSEPFDGRCADLVEGLRPRRHYSATYSVGECNLSSF